MAKLDGTVDGQRPASVTVDQGQVSLEVDGAMHGPKTIAGSVSNEDKGQVWTIGLGTIRAKFVPDDPSAFNQALSQEIAGTDPAELTRSLFEMSPNVAEGVAAMNRLFDIIEQTSRVFGETPPDFTSVRESFDRLKRQHADFLQHLAPRGWAQSAILERLSLSPSSS